MHKKVLAICAALVALAVVPAVASASPVLTENGTAVEAGKKITAIGEENSTLVTNLGTVSCNDFWMTGSVHRNTGTIFEGTIEKATFHNENASHETEDCSSGFGPTRVTIPALTNEGGTSHWCIYANNELGDKFEVKGNSCTSGAGTLTFVLDVTNLGLTCKYERSAAVKGSFTTGGTVATLKVEEEPVFTGESTNSGFCPTSGKIQTMHFRIYTDTETFALSTEDPLTIS